MPSLGAVRHITAAKAMPLYDAFETTPLGNANCIHKVALGKKSRPDNVTGLYFPCKVAEFFDPLHGDGVVLLDMAQKRFGHPAFLLVLKSELDRFIAVSFHGFALDNAIRPGEHDCDRYQDPLVIIDAGLAKFFSKESEHKSDFNGDIDARWKVKLLEFVH